MKKLLLLTLGFSLAAQNVNGNLLTQNEARDIRKAAAAVYVGSTGLKAANVDLGESVNGNVAQAQLYSKLLYSVLAAALEEGELAVKFANVLKEVDLSSLIQDTRNWYNANDDAVKKTARGNLKAKSKQAVFLLSAATAIELGEILADKFLNSKIENKLSRRATRALTYAATYALTTALFVMIGNKLSAAKDAEIAYLATGRDTFINELVATFIKNLAFETAGEMAALYLIEPKAATTVAAEEVAAVVEAVA